MRNEMYSSLQDENISLRFLTTETVAFLKSSLPGINKEHFSDLTMKLENPKKCFMEKVDKRTISLQCFVKYC